MNPSGCKARYRDRDIMNHFSNSIYMKYLECLQIEEVAMMANILDNYYICPFCSKYGVSLNNDPVDHHQDKFTLNCLECKKTWCCKCKNLAHYPDPCGKLVSSNRISLIIDEIVDNTAIHSCPQCFLKYDKEIGCNLITCSRCGCYSCYVCGDLIITDHNNSDPHSHFIRSADSNNVSRCPLYNGTGSIDDVRASNIIHDKKKVLNALENLVRKNLDDLKIAKNIYDEIVKKKYVINNFKTIIDSKELVTDEEYQRDPRSQDPRPLNHRLLIHMPPELRLLIHMPQELRLLDPRRYPIFNNDTMKNVLIILMALLSMNMGYIGFRLILSKNALKVWAMINAVLFFVQLVAHICICLLRRVNDNYEPSYKSFLEYVMIINALIYFVGYALHYKDMYDTNNNICNWNETFSNSTFFNSSFCSLIN
jgi:hypothetical protein